jgi:hypothetical protein
MKCPFCKTNIIITKFIETYYFECPECGIHVEFKTNIKKIALSEWRQIIKCWASKEK